MLKNVLNLAIRVVGTAESELLKRGRPKQELHPSCLRAPLLFLEFLRHPAGMIGIPRQESGEGRFSFLSIRLFRTPPRPRTARKEMPLGARGAAPQEPAGADRTRRGPGLPPGKGLRRRMS